LIKNVASESLPTESELASALTPGDAMTLLEWIEFMGPPDILLEKELCWPVEPELVY
jgi:hypothetical protein